MTKHSRFLVLSIAPLLLSAAAIASAASYEVWAVDQNENVLYVLDPDGKVLRTVDGATLGDVKRPHMLYGVPRDEYVYSANTVSNSVSVLEQPGREDQGRDRERGQEPARRAAASHRPEPHLRDEHRPAGRGPRRQARPRRDHHRDRPQPRARNGRSSGSST